ncbi:MAG TPA: tRNA adenosine(34) deaminase TadA [Candidatus Binataceae bacterium]|nr:tRNA adenosine(34) deaminase TadA [Candidatus Binataceae bacterium]
MNSSKDQSFMAIALEEARKGAEEGEVPVGAVAVVGAQIVSRAHNRPIALLDPTAHAEILALREAARAAQTHRLIDLTLYATLEPCVMCVGAMVTARVGRLVYGARDEKAGALGSVYDIGRDGMLNHRIDVTPGVMATECAKLLQQFFQSARGRSA